MHLNRLFWPGQLKPADSSNCSKNFFFAYTAVFVISELPQKHKSLQDRVTFILKGRKWQEQPEPHTQFGHVCNRLTGDNLTEPCVSTALGADQQLCASSTNIWLEILQSGAFLKETFGCIYTWFRYFTRQCFYRLCERDKEDSGGFVLCVCVFVSDIEGLFDGEDDVFNLRYAVVLQDLSVRHGDVDTCHPGDWRIQVVKGRT